MKSGIVMGLLTLLPAWVSVSCCRTGGPKEALEVFPGEATAVKLEAVGAELDPHFFSQNVTRDDGAREADWQYVVDRVKAMELQKFRVMALPQWWEPENDNDDPAVADPDRFTFDSPEMESMYRVLDLAQDRNMEVCIVVWGCPTSARLLDPDYAHVKRCFLADPAQKDVWITGPTDYEEWAENFAVLIKHLIQVRGYTCVREITPMNEPDGGPLLSGEAYIEMAKILDARFKKEGIRDKVRFNLSDNTDTRTWWLENCAENLAGVADVFNSHTYIFGYETPNATIFDWEKNNVEIAARAGKKHLVGEFGSNQCVGATRQRDIDRYDRGVLMTRLVLNFFNAGAAGVSYWSLIDQYYNRDADYAQMQQLGLWKYVREAYRGDSTSLAIETDYQVRPQYHAYSLLARFLKPGAQIHPINLHDDFAAGTAFRGADGKWVYVFANATDSIRALAVNNPPAAGEFEIYRYERNSLPADDTPIACGETVKTGRGRLRIELKPHSVVLCRQK